MNIMNNILSNEFKERLRKWSENKTFNPIINPITGYKIKENGPTYKIIEKMYKELILEEFNNKNINMVDIISNDFNKKLKIEDNVYENFSKKDILNINAIKTTNTIRKNNHNIKKDGFRSTTEIDHVFELQMIKKYPFEKINIKEWANSSWNLKEIGKILNRHKKNLIQKILNHEFLEKSENLFLMEMFYDSVDKFMKYHSQKYNKDELIEIFSFFIYVSYLLDPDYNDFDMISRIEIGNEEMVSIAFNNVRLDI